MSALGFLDRERSVAHGNFNRWLVPPAALAIHLSIGQVYAYSVFKVPLSHRQRSSSCSQAIRWFYISAVNSASASKGTSSGQ